MLPPSKSDGVASSDAVCRSPHFLLSGAATFPELLVSLREAIEFSHALAASLALLARDHPERPAVDVEAIRERAGRLRQIDVILRALLPFEGQVKAACRTGALPEFPGYEAGNIDLRPGCKVLVSAVLEDALPGVCKMNVAFDMPGVRTTVWVDRNRIVGTERARPPPPP